MIKILLPTSLSGQAESPSPSLSNQPPVMESPSPSLSDQPPVMESPSPVARKYRKIALLKAAGVQVDLNEYKNLDKIDKLLQNGAVYNDQKMRYWVDLGERDCFAIYARGLNIDSGHISKYWQWPTDSDGIEMAEAMNIKWLGVSGSFRTVYLEQMVRYKVSFRLKTTPSSTMAGKVVNLALTLPDGTKQETRAMLPAVPSSGNSSWTELEVGQFCMTARNLGEIKFAMEKAFESWETGLVIKGVEIKAV